MRKIFYRCAAAVLAAMMMLSGCSAQEQSPAEQPSGAVLDISLTEGSKEISEDLFGIFLEDINFAVDAGLYAELVKNRSFEYSSLAANGSRHGWSYTDDPHVIFDVVNGSDGTWLNENNPRYARLTNEGEELSGIYNKGYLDGLAVTGGADYTASLYIRGNIRVQLSLENSKGEVYASADIDAGSEDWWKYSVTLTPDRTVDSDLRFAVRIGQGTADIDMISLMPDDTFAGLPVRKDLGEHLQALEPSFIRFPGGCAVEGKTEQTMYKWKDSVGGGIDFTVNGQSAVGDAATRPQTTDLWAGNDANPYYCTYGLGFYEYFLLCEALECMPVPIVNAGMTCPIQSSNYVVYPLNSKEFRQYVQDALDLVEFCRGGAETEWGAVRIAMGHEAPFELRYVGIGNEQWQHEYYEHYDAFVTAFKRAAKEDPEVFGGIELIVANGPVYGNTEGWNYIDDYADDITTLVDEHYYEYPEWFLANTERYDSYDRKSQAKVFLGEYAAKSNTMGAALAEAAYMTGLERNGDIVELASYAPLFGNSTFNQWTPDMIFFSRNSSYLTPNYYVQKLFGTNNGTEYLSTGLELVGDQSANALSGGVGLASWQTAVSYDNLRVVDNESGKVLYENDFNSPSDFGSDFDYHEGEWEIEEGCLVQTNTSSPADTNTGDAVYVGDTGWSDYTMTVDAEILGGDEGFLIPVCVKGTKNNIFWNIGGWGNTVSCLQIVSNGVKSDRVSGTVSSIALRQNQVYELKITVSGSNIKCWIDDQLYIDYTQPVAQSLFASTVRDENGDVIVKIVNVSDRLVPVTLNIPGISEGYSSTAKVTVLSADSGAEVNSLSKPDNICPGESEMQVDDSFSLEAQPYSLTVIRISAR